MRASARHGEGRRTGWRGPALRALAAGLALAATPAGAARLEPAGEQRLLLPKLPASATEVALELVIRVKEDLAALGVARVGIRGLDGAPLAAAAPRLEGVRLDGATAASAGQELALRLVLSAAPVLSAGEYPIDISLWLVPAADSARLTGPPAPVEETLLYSLSRRLALLTATAPGRLEARIRPWDPGVTVRTRVHVSESSGRIAIPPLELGPRGAALRLDAGLAAAPLGLAGAPEVTLSGGDAAELDLALTGSVGAGQYRLPLEIRSGGAAAPVPLDLELWVRHQPVFLLAAMVGGVLLGVLLGGLGRGRESAAARVAVLSRGREAVARHRAGVHDHALLQRLDAIDQRLRRKESRSAFGGGDPAQLSAEAEAEALVAIRELESRRLMAERALIEVEAALQPAPSGPPEIEATLASFLRRAEELHHRLDRGEVDEVEDELAPLRMEAARDVGEAGRRWLVAARDLLETLRPRIPQSARTHLMESVRLALESFAGRIADGSVERIRDTLQAGRNAATTLGEQSFALAYKPALRDLAELGAVLAEFLPETALRPVEAARRAAEVALEPGPLADPFRPVHALAEYQDAAEQALQILAGEAWSQDPWKAVREASALREYGHVAEAVESVLRHRGRERADSRRRARVLEIVRLAPRPSPPAFRIDWDAPPVVGFPLLARIVWLGLEPRRYGVSWTAEGLPVKCERPGVPSTSLRFEDAGWAALRAVVEVEGESTPLVAQARLRVLPEARGGAGWKSGRSALPWRALEALVAMAIAAGAGWALFADRFTGTPRDYALAIGLGLLVELAAERVRALGAARGAAAANRGAAA